MHLKVLVLFSGGIDSTTLIGYWRSEEADVTPLTITYPERNPFEKEAAIQVAQFYNMSLQEVELSFSLAHLKQGYQPFRNTVFAALGLSYAEAHKISTLSLGFHSGGAHPQPDGSLGFMALLQALAYYASRETVIVECPFVNWSKKEVVEEAKRLNAPLHLTVSCFYQKNCGKCAGCLNRQKYL